MMTELDKLKKRSNLDGKRVADLLAERTHLQLRLKDRDEELRGKAKLLDVSNCINPLLVPPLPRSILYGSKGPTSTFVPFFHLFSFFEFS
jgi:hypothetical protein